MTQLEPPPTMCYYHPNRPATLRCNNCDRPICLDDAIKVPTGYRCKECVRGQQKKFNTARWYDFPLSILIAGGISSLGGFLLQVLAGFGGIWMYFIIFAASPAVGAIIASAVRLVIRNRRSRGLFRAVALAVAVGGLLPSLGSILDIFMGNIYSVISLVLLGIYVFLATTTAYYRLSGIQLKLR